jgi:hypothetical protein
MPLSRPRETYRAQTMLPDKASTRRTQDIMISTGDMVQLRL